MYLSKNKFVSVFMFIMFLNRREGVGQIGFDDNYSIMRSGKKSSFKEAIASLELV